MPLRRSAAIAMAQAIGYVSVNQYVYKDIRHKG
jgi:hypothetical protein